MIARGRTAELYTWKDDQVIKLYVEGRPLTSIEREAQITSAVHKAGLPVPSVKGIVRIQGRLGIVFERVYGPTMLQVLKSSPWRINELTGVLAKLHSEIHAHELPGLPSLLDVLERDINGLINLPDEYRRMVLSHLRQLPDGKTLCHLDFHPGNIIMSSHGPVVIDWDNPKHGDPRADIAATLIILRSVALQRPHFMPIKLLINILHNRFHKSYLKKYLKLRPASLEEIALWELPMITRRLADNIPGEKDIILAVIKKAYPS